MPITCINIQDTYIELNVKNEESMSAVIQIFPQCDLCHVTNPDIMHDELDDVVVAVVLDGWNVVDDDFWLCPECDAQIKKRDAEQNPPT